MQKPLSHNSLIVDQRDFNDPSTRASRYADPRYTPARSIALRCWLRYSHKGIVSLNWAEIGMHVGECHVLHVLFESGQTGQLVAVPATKTAPQLVFLHLPGSAPRRAYRVYHVRPTGKDVLWTYRTEPWTDRNTALTLLDSVVHLWPRLNNQHMGAVSEPLRVVALYIRDKHRIGLGLTQHTSELVPSPTPGPRWRPRPMHEVQAATPARYVTAEEALRPPLVLWGKEGQTVDYLAALTTRDAADDPDKLEEWADHAHEYSGCRVLTPCPAGGDPLLWGSKATTFGGLPTVDDVLSGEADGVRSSGARSVLASTPFGLPPAQMRKLAGAWWCRRCLAESHGLDRVAAVENGLCLLHAHLENHERPGQMLRGLTCPDSPSGRHSWIRPPGNLPYCKYGCGAIGKS